MVSTRNDLLFYSVKINQKDIVNHRNSLTPQNPLTLNQTYLKTVDFYKISFTYSKFYADSENEFRFF